MTKPYIERKFIAVIIDYSIILTIDYNLIVIFGKPAVGNPESYELTGISLFIIVIPWLIFTVCLETFLGSTLGNGIMSLKPVDQKNQNRGLTFIQSFQRHLLDPIDMFFFGLVGYLVMKHNNGLRLGDLWAKTVVVDMKSKNKNESIKTE
ncbi:RDD family protein [Flavobacterium sp. ST-87]|uniref:RDD family protein n=1 Tax=Flavobacterium plantiphilum TaxID=3163297 RepID=A0ABW8XV91_9FLAO